MAKRSQPLPARSRRWSWAAPARSRESWTPTLSPVATFDPGSAFTTPCPILEGQSLPQDSAPSPFRIPETRELELVSIRLDDGRIVVRTAEELLRANPRPTPGGVPR